VRGATKRACVVRGATKRASAVRGATKRACVAGRDAGPMTLDKKCELVFISC